MRSGTNRAGAGDVAAVASLDEPTRRRVYEHLGACTVPVGRDDVADSLGIPRRTAAFHLDRLAELDLVAVSFARRTGRSGPGAGRPAKFYERSSREVSVSLPPRQYDLAGSLLAGAVVQAQLTGEPPVDVLDRRAHDFGHAMAVDRREMSGPDGRGDTDTLMNILEKNGFEPQVAGAGVVLNNCPFHALAQEHAELVCGMSLHLLEGLLTGIGQTGLRARLDPAPSRCCVRLECSGQG